MLKKNYLLLLMNLEWSNHQVFFANVNVDRYIPNFLSNFSLALSYILRITRWQHNRQKTKPLGNLEEEWQKI